MHEKLGFCSILMRHWPNNSSKEKKTKKIIEEAFSENMLGSSGFHMNSFNLLKLI